MTLLYELLTPSLWDFAFFYMSDVEDEREAVKGKLWPYSAMDKFSSEQQICAFGIATVD